MKGMKRTGSKLSVCLWMLSVLFVVTRVPVMGQDFFSGDRPPRLNLIDRSNGLPHNSVSAIQQDARGFLWFGTQGGLARYDGKSFKIYKSIPFDPESLPHNLVQTVYYEEKRDTLWVGTYNGLARFVLGETGFTDYQYDPDDDTTISENVVIAVGEGPDGEIWVGTQKGLNRFEENGTFRRFSIEGDVVRAIYTDSRGTMWVGTYGGLFYWDAGEERFVAEEQLWSSPAVMAITEVEPGVLLLGTWGAEPDVGGVVLLDVDTGTVTEHHLPDNRVYTVLSASDGTVWAGTWGGGLHVITDEGERFEFGAVSPEGLASPVVYSLLEDTSGLVWVGTNGGGVHYLSPRRRNFRAFFHDSENPATLPAGKVNAILRDSRGILWVGLYSGGLARYDAEDNRWVQYDRDPGNPYSLANDIVTDIYEDRDGNLWIGTNGGLQLYDRESDRFLRWGEHIYQDLPFEGTIVYRLGEDSYGNFWIGTYHAGVTVVDRSRGEAKNFQSDPNDPASLSDNLVFDFLLDSNDDFWIATNGGLNRFRPGSGDFEVFRYAMDKPDGLTSNTVRVLFEDSRRNFWIGTVSGGLNRLDRRSGAFTYLTEQDGLSDNTVVSILEGADGTIWLGTPRGLTVYNPEDGRIDVVDEQDGLFGSEFHSGHLQDTDGTLLFGGGHGITRIDASAARSNAHVPPVQITDVKVFQESIMPSRQSHNGTHIDLSPEDMFLNIEFVGLDFESPDSNQYAYQLVGFDRERILAGSRNVATYTNLPPGRFEFRAWATNGDGVWSDEPARLSIRVNSPWYERWWAYLLYGVAVVLLVLGALRWRTARILEAKNRDLEYANFQLARANTELERLSVRDALTGLFNRRYFDSRVQEEWFRARRSHQPLALLMIDIDHFKRFNDNYGHVAGDRVLSATATVFQNVVVRQTDFVARYGGEEFVALLYDTPDAGAAAIAERIRVSMCEGILVPRTEIVSVSIGYCVTVPDTQVDAEILLRCADEALYRAKRNGRNRVERGVLVERHTD